MFERLVTNKVDFSQLKRQRRMIPEIRRALNPIYQDLEDHPSVLDRAPVPGMGGVNSYFFTHTWRETTDAQMSKINEEEADMIVGLFTYLVANGMDSLNITVLTFYNGQRKLILKKLRDQRHLLGEYFKVVTVDSYQGEENEVVLLSLVRCNIQGKIGFLDVENRVCVALSRAQRGFYLFGDALNLCKSSQLWWEVVNIMAKDPRRVGFYMQLTCEKHEERTFVKEPYDFRSLDGGCTKPCREQMACGHVCALNCHPFPHEAVNCQKRCTRSVGCGHPCTQACYLECKSDCDCEAVEQPGIQPLDYAKATRTSVTTLVEKKQGSGSRQSSPEKKQQHGSASRASPQVLEYVAGTCQDLRGRARETQLYRDFAAGGHVESDKNLAALAQKENAEARQKQLDKESYEALFGGTEEDVLAKELDNVKLVRTKSNGRGGTRGVWKGTFEVPRSESTSPKKQQEGNLLDL
jgi:helicase required for RNAi-mediated heterochromatin assembly 1